MHTVFPQKNNTPLGLWKKLLHVVFLFSNFYISEKKNYPVHYFMGVRNSDSTMGAALIVFRKGIDVKLNSSTGGQNFYTAAAKQNSN